MSAISQSSAPGAPPKYHPSPADRFYAPLVRSRFVVALLCVNVVTDVVGIGFDSAIIAAVRNAGTGGTGPSGGGADQDLLDLLELGNALVSLVSFAVYIATAVLFCCWLFRVVKNAHMITEEHGPSPGLAAGSFFIPFYNLWGPFLAVKFAWSASGRFAYIEESARPRLALVGAWWGTWVLGNIIGRIIMQQAVNSWGQQPTPDQLARESTANIAMGVVNAVGAVLCIAVVLKLTRMQRSVQEAMVEAAGYHGVPDPHGAATP